jgi:ATP synthase in type III secretion protein N
MNSPSSSSIPVFTPRLIEAAQSADTRPIKGKIKRVSGNLIHAVVPGVCIGEICDLHDPETGKIEQAEVIGFDDALVMLSPLGATTGLSTATEVSRTKRFLDIAAGEALLGRVLDGFGRPMDGRSLSDLSGLARRPLNADAPPALTRRPISNPFPAGLRVIDGLLTWGEGQRIGIYGPAGSGKSLMLAQVLRAADADVRIAAFVGERGREVNEFLEKHLPHEIRGTTAIIVATSDRPAIERIKAAYTAMTLAEYFRDQGARVLLAVDSITRLARALREVALAAGEPALRRGYPPSVFSALPALLERAGTASSGSITGLFTVLTEGDGNGDPVAEETRALLDAHIVLSASLAQAGHFPAVDVAASLSRVMPDVTSAEHYESAQRIRQVLAKYNEVQFLLQVGEYKAGNDRLADVAIAKWPAIERFLKQQFQEYSTLDVTADMLRRLSQ